MLDLHGLGETGTKGDAAHLIPLLEHPRPAIRKAALVALARLDPDRAAEPLRGALESAQPGLSALARRQLARNPAPTDWLERLVRDPQRPEHVRNNALTLWLKRARSWEAMVFLLELLEREDDLAAPALQRLQHRLRTLPPCAPPAPLSEALGRAFERNRHRLPAEFLGRFARLGLKPGR